MTEFYIVATPIGNLGDISYRAVEILKNVDFIACEDTRVTKKLLEKYQINAKLFDCHKFNEKEKSYKIISLLQEKKSVALVSDAGTPCISDPGSILIKELLNNNVKITSVPGACAITTFLTLIPRETEEYAFIGFLPRNAKQQKEILDKYKYTNCVFYDSPNRLFETLENIKLFYGGNTKVAVGRELTKIFEEIKILSVDDMITYYKNNPLKGEIVAMIFAQEKKQLLEQELFDKINILKEEGFSHKDISKIIAKLYKENKNKIYQLIVNSTEK